MQQQERAPGEERLSARQIIEAARDQVAKETPDWEVLTLLLQKEAELGPGNDGMVHAYIRDACEALTAVMHAIEAEAVHYRHDDSLRGHSPRRASRAAGQHSKRNRPPSR